MLLWVTVVLCHFVVHFVRDLCVGSIDQSLVTPKNIESEACCMDEFEANATFQHVGEECGFLPQEETKASTLPMQIVGKHRIVRKRSLQCFPSFRPVALTMCPWSSQWRVGGKSICKRDCLIDFDCLGFYLDVSSTQPRCKFYQNEKENCGHLEHQDDDVAAVKYVLEETCAEGDVNASNTTDDIDFSCSHGPHGNKINSETHEVSNLTCPYIEFTKDMRIDAIKKEILEKLNIVTPPNVSTRNIPQVPRLQAIIDKVGRDPYNYDDEPKSNLILFGKSSEDDNADDNECYFHLRSDLFTKRVERVSLGLFVRKPWRYNTDWSGWLLISFENKVISRKKLTMVESETNMWYTFNITNDSKDWFLLRKTKIHMRVVGSDPNGKSLTIVKPLTEHERDYRPYLFLKVKDHVSSRLKRTLTEDCSENGQDTRCCRYPLHVNFQEMGWNWIIVPHSYNAHCCAGECPPAYKESNVHSHITELDGVLKCCSGRKFGSISIIYFDENSNIIVGRVANMVVEQCECV